MDSTKVLRLALLPHSIEAPWFKSRLGDLKQKHLWVTFLCGVFLFSPCMCSPGTLASSYQPKTCFIGYSKIVHRHECECVVVVLQQTGDLFRGNPDFAHKLGSSNPVIPKGRKWVKNINDWLPLCLKLLVEKFQYIQSFFVIYSIILICLLLIFYFAK